MFWMELYALPFKTHLVLKTGQMYSKLGIQLTTIPTCILYMILIFVSIKAWLNLMAEQTAFEETTFESNKKIPSFTSCQKLIGNNKSMESFEDVATAIKKVESKFTIEFNEYDWTLGKEISMVENYNNTFDSVWKFVPKINIWNPYEDAICLIWTPSKEQRPEKGIVVCIILPLDN